MSCVLILTTLNFDDSKFLHITFFGHTSYTSRTAWYSEHSYIKNYLSTRCSSFFKLIFEKSFALFGTRKQVPAKMFQKGSLWLYNQLTLWWKQNSSLRQDKKIMHQPVSNTHCSFRSECVKKTQEKSENKSRYFAWKIWYCTSRLLHRYSILQAFERALHGSNPTVVFSNFEKKDSREDFLITKNRSKYFKCRVSTDRNISCLLLSLSIVKAFECVVDAP